MQKSCVGLNKIWIVIGVSFILILTLSPVWGFEYGKLKRDRDTTRIFQKYEVIPNHKYYICGQGNIPFAIIGI
ncbi:MAG: hypothetical protein JRF72_05595, partial [Deltaproteobacteria bacterium]|nr:hypothetical protein [Deltaproteobacteria bacterium]